ncbi:DUF2971 domain-containing protein [Rhizobium oryzicola]|uniref:DUF2971 domain-containing protein n=1 Tax=Rhizobium oryzicola TaxID=1232668 RepID=A0ABT8ST57_9HYPH|nr:DUF2971 domain-containing protein [Rhizobium oryzicola]MDO1580912.1 DUF2971 domain-containing protein [Rhizobium oryzicola]
MTSLCGKHVVRAAMVVAPNSNHDENRSNIFAIDREKDLACMSDDLEQIFSPIAFRQMQQFRDSGRRFAYYTDADTALKIISGEKLWLRKSQCMNDSAELHWGLSHLSRHQERITAALNQAFSHIGEDLGTAIWHLFMANEWKFRWNSFVACVSEHGPEDDRFGRLSMWRAYGRNSGVALVFHADKLMRLFQMRGQWASPVFYADEDSFSDAVGEWERSVRDGTMAIRAHLTTADDAIQSGLRWLAAATICTKHRAFEEEREWRAIIAPDAHPADCERFVHTFGNTPQVVYSMPLNCGGAEPVRLVDLLERIIIGPCQFPAEVFDALVHTLRPKYNETTQFSEWVKIHDSQIPLRANPA